MSESDTLTRGPEETTTPIDEAARLDKVVGGIEEAQAAEQPTVLPEADQAPVAAPAAEMTETDEADVAKLSNHVVDLRGNGAETTGTLDQAAPEVRTAAVNKTDASARLNEVYSNEAAAATPKIAETKPGSPEEKAQYAAFKSNVDTQVASIRQEELANKQDEPSIAKEQRKRTWRHPFKGEAIQ